MLLFIVYYSLQVFSGCCSLFLKKIVILSSLPDPYNICNNHGSALLVLAYIPSCPVYFVIFDLVMVIGFEKLSVGLPPMSGMNVAPFGLAFGSDRQLGHLRVETFQATAPGVAKCIS